MGSKITADGDSSHEIKRRLLLGRKVMTNLDSILKSRDITLPTKVHLVKAMVCPVVMYGCESWTIKEAERWRIDAFELWCWRRLLRVPLTARKSNQSILKEINPDYSLEGLMLKLKLQYFGHLMQRADSFERTLMMGKIEGRRRRGWQRMRWLDGITNSMDMKVKVKVARSCLTLRPHGPYSPWNSPAQNTGVGSLSLLQGNLPNPGIEPRSPTLQADSLPTELWGKPQWTWVWVNSGSWRWTGRPRMLQSVGSQSWTRLSD